MVGAPGAWRLESVGAALRRAEAAAPQGAILLHTDIEEFYASITPSVLARTLALIGVSHRDARLAGEMVEGWGARGYAGLPIGPPGSAVVANAILRSVDEALASLRFVRWVDDYVIALPTERAEEFILELMDETLARLGLRRSHSKTGIVEATNGIAWLSGVSAATRRVSRNGTEPGSSR